MIIALRSLRTWATFSSFAFLAAVANAQAPLTGLDKQLDRIDLGISGSGILNNPTSGTNKLNQTLLTDKPGNTVGVLVDIRYIKSPLVGLELNVNYARYVQNFSGTQFNPPVTATSPLGTPTPYVLDIQSDSVEYTLGWVFHPPKVFGIGTFASAGAGATDFVPSRGGGLSFKPQARATYYYNIGLEQTVINPHFGLRVSFRQAYFLAPDFETNYLTDLRHTHTTEPTAGFYLHF
jgi:hypothetical protein